MDGIDIKATVSTSDLARVRSAPASSAGAAAAAAAAQPAASLQTSISTANANLTSLLADSAPPIDSKKVDAIRSLIAEGRYPIDEHAIAVKMIAMDIPEPSFA